MLIHLSLIAEGIAFVCTICA